MKAKTTLRQKLLIFMLISVVPLTLIFLRLSLRVYRYSCCNEILKMERCFMGSLASTLEDYWEPLVNIEGLCTKFSLNYTDAVDPEMLRLKTACVEFSPFIEVTLKAREPEDINENLWSTEPLVSIMGKSFRSTQEIYLDSLYLTSDFCKTIHSDSHSLSLSISFCIVETGGINQLISTNKVGRLYIEYSPQLTEWSQAIRHSSIEALMIEYGTIDRVFFENIAHCTKLQLLILMVDHLDVKSFLEYIRVAEGVIICCSEEHFSQLLVAGLSTYPRNIRRFRILSNDQSVSELIVRDEATLSIAKDRYKKPISKHKIKAFVPPVSEFRGQYIKNYSQRTSHQ